MGKNLAEARGDVLKAIEVVECACSTHYLMSGDTIMNVSSGYDTVSYREPLGVFAGIVPFNFPAMISFGWLIPFAITTGNTYVLKAASMVPQTAMRMLELLQEVKNHALVMRDCVLERSVLGVINSTYGCAGQRFMVLPVVVVEEAIAGKFVERLKYHAES